MSKGILLVISGPSGVGKTTLARRLMERGDYVQVTTCTTRPPREGEVDGTDYHFLSREEFERRIDAGGFLEHAIVHGKHRYGTPKPPVEEALAAGSVVVLTIDVQGAASVRKTDLPQVTVFVMPPDREELLRRIRERGTEGDAEIARRLEEAEGEMAQKDRFDAVVVNDDLDAAAEAIVTETEKRR